MDKLVAHWVERSQYDLDTAKINEKKAEQVYKNTREIHKWIYQKIN